MGYRITPSSGRGLTLARQTIERHKERIARLYEQVAGKERIGQYVKGWWQWVNAGVDVMVGKAAELWAQKCDELCWGMKILYECSNSDVHSKSADALPITLMWPNGSQITFGCLS